MHLDHRPAWQTDPRDPLDRAPAGGGLNLTWNPRAVLARALAYAEASGATGYAAIMEATCHSVASYGPALNAVERITGNSIGRHDNAGTHLDALRKCVAAPASELFP